MSIAAQQRRAASGDEEYDPNMGWKEAAQMPLMEHLGTPSMEDLLKEVDAYLGLKESTLPVLEDALEKFVKALPFKVDRTDACAKGPERSRTKLTDPNSSALFNPAKIRDFYRATIYPQTPEELAQVTAALDAHEWTIARKNRFDTPEEETGMRDYKAIWKIPLSDEIFVLAEVKVEYGPMKAAYAFTEQLRASERVLKGFKENAWHVCGTLKDNAEEKQRLSMRTAVASGTAEMIRAIRKDIHDSAAENTGANLLLNPKLRSNSRNIFEQLFNHVDAALGNVFGERLLTEKLRRERIEAAIGPIPPEIYGSPGKQSHHLPRLH